MSDAMLEIRNLHVRVEQKPILRGVELVIRAGEVHAVMGPNGSGKSTLAQVLAGREDFEVTGGSVTFEGRDLLALPPEERARAGLFLGFQYPVEIPGVNNVYLLKAALNAKRKAAGEPEVDAYEFLSLIRQKMKFMHMSESFLTRGVNEGFSGGEKKRNEVLQMMILEPKLAILDETDSGLDIDALKVVSSGVIGSRAMLGREALAALARYDWPGNVRELQNALAALAVTAPRRGTLGCAALPVGIVQCGADALTLDEARRRFDASFVRGALARAGGCRSRAATDLGLTRQGLAKLMERLSIVAAGDTLRA
jgi:Fe-S cluster assembly ATP-binding protein